MNALSIKFAEISKRSKRIAASHLDLVPRPGTFPHLDFAQMNERDLKIIA
jgi:hypothetical protein